jgi:hypothetical protein
MTNYMGYNTRTLPLSDNSVDTRKKRRLMVRIIRDAIDKIHFAEGMAMSNVPKNLRNSESCKVAIRNMDLLEEALVALDKSYHYWT